MRALFVALALLFTITMGYAQQKTSAKKKSATTKSATTTRKSTTTTVKKTPAKPQSTTLTRYQSTTTAPIEFPSTAATNEPMDPVKKQEMYDELHGVKAKPATIETSAGKNDRRNRRGRNAKPTDVGVMPADSASTTETVTRPPNRYGIENAGSEARMHIGVRAGGNYNTLLDQPTGISIDPTYGFHGGIVFLFGRGGIAFQPEINFNQDYTKVLNPGTLKTDNVSVSSLVVPLLVKFQFGQQGRPRFFVNVGPYGTYAVDAQTTSLGYGGALGIGMGFPMGPGKFTVEARGYYALGDNSGVTEFGNVPGKPTVGQLSVGYLFPLGGR
ncbi:PorT family protein [Fibrella sp. HMF5335]|uniref:PorT family protein n=1 Tax=Fibrella rubiginis TaxID=2817060 RepID=A0A939K7V6_9BACT|nr:porin family protein [Fibrella rubiginis]MBO0939851.1 PorT family protein [Fibrella rubiginis]